MKKLDLDTAVDVAPIINVSLVIVLTLMIIAPGLDNSDNPVDLPAARAQDVEDSDRLELTYTSEGRIYLDDVEVRFEDIRSMAEASIAQMPDLIAVVKADRTVLYGEVEKLIAELEKAQPVQIAIATRSEEIDEQ
jgi:biopolymer transport protein ExbD